MFLIVAFLSFGHALAFSQSEQPHNDTVSIHTLSSCHHAGAQTRGQMRDGHCVHRAAGHCLGCGIAVELRRFRLPVTTLEATVPLVGEMPLVVRLVHFRPPILSIG